MTTRATSVAVQVVAVRGGERRTGPDQVATEEPLEVRAGGPGQAPAPVAVTMRTPGHDFELAAGFLRTEGLVGDDDVRAIRYCVEPGGVQEYNVVTVDLRSPLDPGAPARRFAATSSCGLCGKATLDDLHVRCDPVGEGPTLPASALGGLVGKLRDGQRVFDRTGGLHAAGLFDAHGELLVLREDVGRHNAVDKVVGHAVLARSLPLADRVLVVSGRLGFEVVQKAAVAGIAVVAGVSAPSSLAVEAAERFGVTLVGFVRGDGCNVYSGAQRLLLDR